MEEVKLQVRSSKPADLPSIWQLIDMIWADLGVGSGAATHQDLADVDKAYRPDGDFWVATIAGQIVGTVALKQTGERVFTLKRMYVLPAFRGRVGTARKLLSAALAHARSHGGEQVVLGTVEEARASHRFYEKNSFKRIEPELLPLGFFRSPEDTRFYMLEL